MIILVEINVKGFFGNVLKRLLCMVKITKWPIVKDNGHKRKTRRCNLNVCAEDDSNGKHPFDLCKLPTTVDLCKMGKIAFVTVKIGPRML